MTKGLIALCLLVAIQAISAYEVAVPVLKQPFGASDGTRIIQGKTATPGQFPHQAGVTINNSGFCGGSLISRNFVLTAAHCVYSYSQWSVTLGAHYIRDANEPGRVTQSTTTAYNHEQYDPNTITNDVGVIQLPQNVQLTNQINVVPLPPSSYKYTDFTGETARVSGWGKTSDASNSISPVLQYTDLTFISLEECRAVYGAAIITNTKYCTSTTAGTSTCNGDSGGSLTVGTGSNFTNIGIVSFGSARGCAIGYPTGFTATPHFVEWISSKTGIPVRA